MARVDHLLLLIEKQVVLEVVRHPRAFLPDLVEVELNQSALLSSASDLGDWLLLAPDR